MKFSKLPKVKAQTTTLSLRSYVSSNYFFYRCKNYKPPTHTQKNNIRFHCLNIDWKINENVLFCCCCAQKFLSENAKNKTTSLTANIFNANSSSGKCKYLNFNLIIL